MSTYIQVYIHDYLPITYVQYMKTYVYTHVSYLIIRRFTKQSTRTCGNLTYLLEKVSEATR